MAGFTSFASTAMQALSLVNTVAKGVNSYREESGSREYEETKQENALRLAAIQQGNTLQKEQSRIDRELQEQDRLNRVRRLMAEQRAKFAGRGIASGDGSSQAVLYGLLEESDKESENRGEAYRIKNTILDQNYNAAQSINTLMLSQMKERNKLNKVSALYNGLSSLI